MERRGKGLAARETERESVCERRRVAENEAGVCRKMAIGRRINYFGISREPNIKIMFSWETILMWKGDEQKDTLRLQREK